MLIKNFLHKDIKEKAWIFEEWKKKWNSVCDENGYSYFIKLFEYDYEMTCRKVQANRTKNFMLKGMSFFLL